MDFNQNIEQKINESFRSSELKFTKGDYHLILLIDLDEYSRIERFIDLFSNNNINIEIRKLNVCDYGWVVREKFGIQELMLPYIVKRYNAYYLNADIVSKHFPKQKYRIRNSGVPNIIYIFEDIKRRYFTTSFSTLFQTAINIKIHHKYKIKFTDSFNDTVIYISQITQYLKTKFEEKTLFKSSKEIANIYDETKEIVPLIDFEYFQKNSLNKKDLDIKTIFLKTLLMISNTTIEKCLKIVEKFPTPRALTEAYATMNEHDGELLLSSIRIEHNKTVGKMLSKSIYKFFTNTSYN